MSVLSVFPAQLLENKLKNLLSLYIWKFASEKSRRNLLLSSEYFWVVSSPTGQPLEHTDRDSPRHHNSRKLCNTNKKAWFLIFFITHSFLKTIEKEKMPQIWSTCVPGPFKKFLLHVRKNCCMPLTYTQGKCQWEGNSWMSWQNYYAKSQLNRSLVNGNWVSRIGTALEEK